MAEKRTLTERTYLLREHLQKRTASFVGQFSAFPECLMKIELFCIILKLYIKQQDSTSKLHAAWKLYPAILSLTLVFVTYRLAELWSHLVQIPTAAAPWMVSPVGSAYVCLMALCGEAFFSTQEQTEGF